MSEVVDINSFMQVIKATRDIEGGIEFPGESMYNKVPVQSQGVTKADLMTNREFAEQWYHSIRSMYERQEEEADHKASGPDLSEALKRRSDPPAGEPRAPEAAASGTVPTLEEELLARHARWSGVADTAARAIERASADYARALSEISKLEAALDAVRGS